MNTEPYGTTTFCDDIRDEVSGKITLVGCYSGDLNFRGPPPGVLPTFSALVNIRIPKSVKFKKLKLRITKEEGDDITEILVAEINSDEEEVQKIIKAAEKKEEDSRVLAITLPCKWSSLPISQPGFIKVRAYLDDDKEIRLGALKIGFSGSSESHEAAAQKSG